MATEVQKGLDKREVAERLAKSAIRLFLESFDPISVHVVASAAAQILHDICKSRDLPTFMDKLATQIREDKRKEFRNILRSANNYFKHADTDPAQSLEHFDARSNETVIFAALQDYATAYGTNVLELKAFEAWFIVTHPEFFPNITPDMMALIDRLKHQSRGDPHVMKESLRELLKTMQV